MDRSLLAKGGVIGERYVLEEPLGKGGMGEVWAARHSVLESRVAIKFLLGASAAHEATRRRFLTEAQVTAQLKTRHAVQVFDYGITDTAQPYLVMELLDGETLAERLKRGKALPFTQVAMLLAQAARALDRAHALGVVHRDFKPENIFVVKDEDEREQVKVVDFGVAKLLGALDYEEPETSAEDRGALDLSTFTRTGNLMGTPFYMAPEQVRSSADVGPRADIWSFGVVAYECVTGQVPFEAPDVLSLFDAICKGRHKKARQVNPDVPLAFDAWFEITCALNPNARFSTAMQATTGLLMALDVSTNAGLEESASGLFGAVSLRGPTSTRRASLAREPAARAAVDEETRPSDGDRSPPSVPRSVVALPRPSMPESGTSPRQDRLVRTLIAAVLALSACVVALLVALAIRGQ